MPDTIQLFAYPTSPYAMKVGCYLKYKQLDYEFVPVNPVTNRQIRFTRQRQVPVLKINDEWRKESSELGIWLDERYPDKPLLGPTQDDRQRILEVDQWISEQLIPSRFREAYEWESTPRAFRNGWKLARAVHSATPLPLPLRLAWPALVKKAGFIVRMVEALDLSEPLPAMRQRMRREFLEHLGDGPFLGEQQQISLADLSAYPIVVSGHLMGMSVPWPLLEDQRVIDWCRRVQNHLPDNPLLIKDQLLERAHV